MHAKPKTSPGRQALVTAVLGAVGIALSVGSWSAAREASPFGNGTLVASMPALMALVAAVGAVAFRKGAPGAGRVIVAVAVLDAVQLLATLMAPGAATAEALVLGVVATVAEAASSTLLLFAFLRALTALAPRAAGIAVAVGYLLVHAYDAAFIGAAEAVRLAQRPLAQLVMLGIGCALARMGSRGSGGAAAHEAGVAEAREARRGGEPAPSLARLALLGGLACALLLVQGVYSQVTGLGSAGGSTQDFNLFTEVFAAGVRAAVLLYCLTRTSDVPLAHVALAGAGIMLVGIPAVFVSWGTGWYLVGSHVVNSARYALLPLVGIVAVQACRHHPGLEAPLLLGSVAVTNSCYVSRLAASAVLGDAPGTEAILPAVSVFALWAVACVICAYLLALRKLDAREGRSLAAQPDDARLSSAEPAAAPRPEDAADPAWARELAFYRRLEAVCDAAQLTDREREVLRAVLHGYSVDAIAGRLSLSASTVKTYLSRAYGRLGVGSRQGVLALLDDGPSEGGATAIDG